MLFLALRDEPAPYVIPVCFGVHEGTIYVHSALVGTKIDLLRRDPVVGFSACTDMVVTPGAAACDFTACAQSVVGTGRARIVESEDERTRGLDSIMSHYSEARGNPPAYRPGSLSRTCVIAISVDTLRGKSIGAPFANGAQPTGGGAPQSADAPDARG